MREAMESRSVIDQAIGIVMAQNRCDAATAFGLLRTASQNRNVKLRVVASDIVDSLTG
jgi:AmiR/NasT family two-component response regulator